jgi:hypothetical protein
MDDEIRLEVLDRPNERSLIEDVAQDGSHASDAQSVDLRRRPRHGRDDMSLGQHERQ